MNHNKRNSQHETLKLTPRGEALSKFSKGVLAVASVASTIGIGAATVHEHRVEHYHQTIEEMPKTTVVIGEGETLWDIAASIAPGNLNLKDVVDVIKDLNPNLPKSQIQMGTEIIIPVYKDNTSSIDLDNNTATISLDK